MHLLSAHCGPCSSACFFLFPATLCLCHQRLCWMVCTTGLPSPRDLRARASAAAALHALQLHHGDWLWRKPRSGRRGCGERRRRSVGCGRLCRVAAHQPARGARAQALRRPVRPRPRHQQQHLLRSQLQAARGWQVQANAICDHCAHTRAARSLLHGPQARARIGWRHIHQQRPMHQRCIRPQRWTGRAEHGLGWHAQPAHHGLRLRPHRAAHPHHAARFTRVMMVVMQHGLPRQMDEHIQRWPARLRVVVHVPPLVQPALWQTAAQDCVHHRPACGHLGWMAPATCSVRGERGVWQHAGCHAALDAGDALSQGSKRCRSGSAPARWNRSTHECARISARRAFVRRLLGYHAARHCQATDVSCPPHSLQRTASVRRG